MLKMLTKFSKLILVVAVSTIAMFAADNSLGTWKRDVAKTKVTPPPVSPVKSQTIVREAVDRGVKHTSKTERMDGTGTESTYIAKYDGKPVAVPGNASYDTISWKQADANTFTMDSRKTDGKYKTTGTVTVSKDGKTMIATQKGTDADGKPTEFTVVFDKQ
jgi:hypothetical protein